MKKKWSFLIDGGVQSLALSNGVYFYGFIPNALRFTPHTSLFKPNDWTLTLYI